MNVAVGPSVRVLPVPDTPSYTPVARVPNIVLLLPLTVSSFDLLSLRYPYLCSFNWNRWLVSNRPRHDWPRLAMSVIASPKRHPDRRPAQHPRCDATSKYGGELNRFPREDKPPSSVKVRKIAAFSPEVGMGQAPPEQKRRCKQSPSDAFVRSAGKYRQAWEECSAHQGLAIHSASVANPCQPYSRVGRRHYPRANRPTMKSTKRCERSTSFCNARRERERSSRFERPRLLQEGAGRYAAKALEMARQMTLVEKADLCRHHGTRHARQQQ